MTNPKNYKDLLAQERECPFCFHSEHVLHAIITNEYASLSLAQAPYTKNHLLIAPIRHCTELLDLAQHEREIFWDLIDKGTQLLYTLGHKGVSILLRDGNTVGKSEAHLHIHIIPDTILNTSESTIQRSVLDKDFFIQKTKEMKKLL